MSNNTKTIYLIRHGETLYNKMGVVQGSGIDADLNETGILQAKAFYDTYKNVGFQKIYVSNLIRTYQTVEQFIQSGIAYEKLEGLNEISWGDREGKVPNTEENEEYSSMLNAWKRGEVHVSPPAGESPLDVAERQKPAIKHILTQENEDLILVAMHGRAMRILLAQIMKLPLQKMDDFEHSNTCLYILEFNYKTQSFLIKLHNDTGHLINMIQEIPS